MKAMKTIKFLTLVVFAGLTFNSCSSDDDAPLPVNEEEVITTVIATFTPQGGGTTITLSSQDLDGDGPNAPEVTVSGGAFVSGTLYNGSVQFLNELENPADDITVEVAEEDDEHQVFYAVTSGIGTFAYTDSDADGNPVGLAFTFAVDETAVILDGVMTITLRHLPNKTATGVSEGLIANAGGETDAEVSFNVTKN